MIEHPILFSAPMVRAILDGRKTQTRRVVKPQPSLETTQWLADVGGTGKWMGLGPSPATGGTRQTWGWATCPYGQPGDRLWVRETWGVHDQGFDTADESTFPVYRADTERPEPKRWRPSIRMPREISRITLEVTGVRVERLQAISESDAIAEGIEPNWCGALDKGPNGTGSEGWLGDSWIHYGHSVDGDPAYSARESFRSLWESINGAGCWDANPWVWVVEFRRAEVAHG